MRRNQAGWLVGGIVGGLALLGLEQLAQRADLPLREQLNDLWVLWFLLGSFVLFLATLVANVLVLTPNKLVNHTLTVMIYVTGTATLAGLVAIAVLAATSP